MTTDHIQILDHKCARLQARLNVLKAAKRDKSTDNEYMNTLYDYREATRKKLEGYAPQWVTPYLAEVTP